MTCKYEGKELFWSAELALLWELESCLVAFGVCHVGTSSVRLGVVRHQWGYKFRECDGYEGSAD